MEKVSRVDGARSLRNEQFRILKSQLRQLKTGCTHASVLQALANMCREEEVIADRQSYTRKRGGGLWESMRQELFWKRRFVNGGLDLQHNEQDSSLFAKYAKRRCQPTTDATKEVVTAFSTNVQELLFALTNKFSNDINKACVSDPSQVMARSGNNPEEVVLRICQVESSMQYIDEDMRKLAEAKSKGEMAASKGFTGFAHLGQDDCLRDEEGSESDSSDDSDESETQCTSDSHGSDDSSEWDADEESLLDSKFMTGMAFKLGFGVPLSRPVRSVSHQMPFSMELAELTVAATASIAPDDVSITASSLKFVDPQIESRHDPDDILNIDSVVEDDYFAHCEVSLCARSDPGRTSVAVPLHYKKVTETSHPNTPLTRSTSQTFQLPTEFDVRAMQAVPEAPFGCFDPTGKPKRNAPSTYQNPAVMSAQECDYLSDLCTAARIAAAIDEKVAPFALTETSSQRPCTKEYQRSEEVGENRYQVNPQFGEVIMQHRFLTQSFNDSTDCAELSGDRSNDRNTSDDPLLVTWGDSPDSDSDLCDEDLLVAWDGDSNSDSDDNELGPIPIVSTWKTREPLLDERIALKSNFNVFLWQPRHESCDSPSDSELNLASRVIKPRDVCVESPNLANVRDATDGLSIAVNSHDDDIRPVLTALAIRPQVAIRGRSRRSTNQRQAAAGRVPFRDAFKTLAPSERIDIATFQENGKDILYKQNENVCCDPKCEVIFPRIDFQFDRKRTRRLKNGESDSLSTRRRRKLRENEIKSAMGVEKCYIEGLCVINMSRGKAIACTMQSLI